MKNTEAERVELQYAAAALIEAGAWLARAGRGNTALAYRLHDDVRDLVREAQECGAVPAPTQEELRCAAALGHDGPHAWDVQP